MTKKDFDESTLEEPTSYAPEPEGNGIDSQVEVEDADHAE